MKHVWRMALGTMVVALVIAAHAVWDDIGPTVGPMLLAALLPTLALIVAVVIVYGAGWFADYLLRAWDA